MAPRRAYERDDQGLAACTFGLALKKHAPAFGIMCTEFRNGTRLNLEQTVVDSFLGMDISYRYISPHRCATLSNRLLSYCLLRSTGFKVLSFIAAVGGLRAIMSFQPDGDAADEANNAQQDAPIPSKAIVQLILAHLTEIGCHETVACLQQESGVGLAAPLVATAQLQQWVQQGQWDVLLRSLSVLDLSSSTTHGTTVAAITAQAVLELADQNEWETAYALLRTSSQRMEGRDRMHQEISARLAALAAVRDQNRTCPVPDDYYAAISMQEHPKQKKRKVVADPPTTSSSGATRQSRRDALALEMATGLAQQPTQRLPTLLQQAVQWQTHTGQFPLGVAEQFADTPEAEQASSSEQKAWDLVLGRASHPTRSARHRRGDMQVHPHVNKRYATLKFGASAVCCAAAFGSHPTLVTGSSDGLLELWDSTSGDLRTDLPYQTEESVLTQDGAVTAVAVSNDGKLLASAGSSDTASNSTICIWRLDTGSLLRRFVLATATTTTLAWAPTSERLLVGCHDGSVREFGLRSGRQLKVFADTSTTTGAYVTCVRYHLAKGSTASSSETSADIVTAAGDGVMRWWDGASAECRRRVVVPTDRAVSVGDQLLTSLDGSGTTTTAPPLHTILRDGDGGWILVPRSHRAVRIEDIANNKEAPRVRQIYDSPTSVMTAATASVHHLYVATEEDTSLHVYELRSGNRLRTLTTSLAPGSTLVYRPFSDILAVYSADRSQKKGKLYLWK